MAKTKTKTVTFAAINIVMPSPHKEARYIKLFEAASEAPHKAKLLADWVGLLGPVHLQEHPQAGPVLVGEFYKYVDLDSTRDWYNVVSRKPAEKSELARLSIPDELKPHFQLLPFVFFARGHRLIYVTRDGKNALSPKQVVSILRVALGSEEIQKKYGFIEITIEPALETLDEILAMNNLRKLEMEITRPNPDDFAEFEQDFLDELEEQQASSVRIQLVAETGAQLIPNEKTKLYAQVAKSNGKVVGTGGVRGKTRTLSTERHPFEQKEAYVPTLELRSAFVLEKAVGILRKFVRAG